MRQASFRCLTCRAIISNTSIGTKHRNHCPLCLWSKHVDQNIPGDRKSSCGARMKPIGLAYKPDGELMVVHLCLNCGRISSNRIAGDDNSYTLSCLLEEPSNLTQDIRTRLIRRGIRLLDKDDTQNVLTILYGYGYLKQ